MLNTHYRKLSVIIALLFIFVLSPYVNALDNSLIPETYIATLLKEYPANESILIQDDLKNLRQLCFRNTTPSSGERIYFATAGGPGAGKTTLFEEKLQHKKNFVYLDPDQRGLRFMINTYLQEFTNDKVREQKIHTRSDWEKLLARAYAKWRASSNYITSILLNEAFDKGYNIAHGTTSTSDQMENLYQKLKANGYKISLLLIYSTDKNRLKAIEHRAKAQNFIQNPQDDHIKKGKLFSDRFPVYFKYADEMEIYWIEDPLLENAIHAATLKRGQAIHIHNAQAMKKFTEQYDKDRKNKDLKSLNEYILAFSEKKNGKY